jgi:hypothetical protein
VTTSSMVGRSEPGCDLGSALNFKDLHHPCWGGERGEPGLYLLHGSAGRLLFQLLVVETILWLCGGGVLQPCRGRRTVAAQLGCNIPSSSSLSWQGRERGPAGALWSGPRCWCGVGGGADAAVGADVVVAGESFPTVEAVSAAYGPTSGSLALMSGSLPLSGDANQSLPVVASVLGP